MKKRGFPPTHYACFDPVVFKDNAREIRSLIEEYPYTRSLLSDSADSFGITSSARVLRCKVAPGHKFATDILALTNFGNFGATSI